MGFNWRRSSKKGQQYIVPTCERQRTFSKLFLKDNDSDSPYVRKDVFKEFVERMDERCQDEKELFLRLWNQQDADRAYMHKIVVATLVFVVVTLVTLIAGLIGGLI